MIHRVKLTSTPDQSILRGVWNPKSEGNALEAVPQMNQLQQLLLSY